MVAMVVIKKRKKNLIKKLQNKALGLAKEICYLRDGRECQVKKHFPQLKMAHSKVMQCDHCITRKNKRYFLDSRNLTVVCSSCNRAKGFGQKSISRAIDDIVKQREGDFFDVMVAADQTLSPFLDWKSISWLEEKIVELEKQRGKR